MPAPARVVIESVRPQVDGGRYTIKRVIGEEVLVEVDVFADGHDQVACELLWKFEEERQWHAVAMEFRFNDHWVAPFMVEKLGFSSVVKDAKVPPGAPKDVKLWFAPLEEYALLRDKWIEEWNTIYNYR